MPRKVQSGTGSLPVPRTGWKAWGTKGGGRPSLDIELRYTLERGVSGFYTYAIYSHPASYGAMGEGESRFINQMTPTFD